MRKFRAICCICLIMASPSGLTLKAQTATGRLETECRSLRGNEFDGHFAETGIIESWPDEGPPVLWTRKLGQGYSGFTGTANRVFTQYQSLTGQYVVCLDADTGETVWQFRTGWPHQPAGLYPGPRSTPALYGENVFYTTPDGQLGCLRQSDGRLVWQQNLFQKFDAPPVEFGYSISPTIVDDKIILPVGGKQAGVVAIAPSDGRLIWATAGHAISHAGILPIRRNGRPMAVAYLKNTLLLLDRNDGTRLAELPLSAGYDEHSAWPIYREPWLWLSAPFRRGSQLLKITDSAKPAFEPVWSLPVLSNDVSSSVLVDDVLYGFDIRDVQSKVHRRSRGTFRAVDLLTGKVRWTNGSDQRRTALRGDVGHASLLVADGKLIMLNDGGELILAHARPDRYDEIGRVPVLDGSICWTQPCLLAGRVLVRDHSRAVCVYLGRPDQLDVDQDRLLTVADIPRSWRIDWASLVFAVEPEYAMDAPQDHWLVYWYLAIILTYPVIAFGLACFALAIGNRFDHRELRRWTARGIALVAGLAGTTLYSWLFNEFIFTWPLVVFVLFEICLYRATPGRRNRAATPWRDRLALLVFLGSLAAYYFLCRRLSLAFEWAFLTGFPLAVPFLLLARKSASKQGWWSGFAEWIWIALAVTAFYWCGASLILWKY